MKTIELWGAYENPVEGAHKSIIRSEDARTVAGCWRKLADYMAHQTRYCGTPPLYWCEPHGPLTRITLDEINGRAQA